MLAKYSRLNKFVNVKEAIITNAEQDLDKQYTKYENNQEMLSQQLKISSKRYG